MLDLLNSELGRTILAVWFLFVGGCVGSFLNVVVYRLPAGMSISWPGSHCPRCKHPIRAYDNLPVLAWFWLRGRCRDCREPIAFRYPLVEGVTAGLFLLLLVVEVFHRGENLPARIPQPGPMPYSQAQCVGLCVLHLGLLCTLLAASLIRWDGNPPPPRLFAPLLFAGLIAASFWPWLHPLPAVPEAAGSRWGGVVDSLLGLGMAYIVGRTAQWLGKEFAGMGRPGHRILGESLVIGVVLGWQAVLCLVPLTSLTEELSKIGGLRWRWLRRLAAAVWIAPWTLLWILNWARISAWLGM